MKTRGAMTGSAILALACAAAGQPWTPTVALSYSLAWQDSGNHNGVLETGESAVLHLRVTMTPPVNTLLMGPEGAVRTLRGIASGFIDLVGTGGTEGDFNLDPAAGYGVDPTWDLLGPPGYGTPNGSGVINVQFGQFPTGSSSVNTTNPIVNVWNAAWTPGSYSPRTIAFGTADGTGAGPGNGSSVIVRYGPLNWNIAAIACLSEFGALQIPIVPAPPGLALLGIGGALACARPRRRS